MEKNSFVDICEVLNLPLEISQAYQNKGLKLLHHWQMECLFTTNVLNGDNLIYCAPTGGGKTLVAELIILKTVITMKKRAILILPYISLVIEKEKEFRRLVLMYNRSKPMSERIRIRGYHGETKAIGKLKENIIVCTIEKANSICNTLISRGMLNQLGCIVVDEMHVLGDFHRGYHLEILISKMKFLIEQSTSTLPFRIQLIALSATIKNIEDLASWFRASLYVTTHRPVPLREMICAGLDVYDLMGTHLRKLNLPKLNLDIESNAMIFFAAEGLQHGQQVIIFCPSRNLCESTVRLICKHSELISPVQGIDLVEARKKAVERYKQTYLPGCHPTPGQELIEQGILHGVAYHHAGLSAEERSIIENLFRDGVIAFLAATTTLAAGVNLPAGRVLIRSMKVGHNQTLEPIQYRQMCGRAGRPGLTEYGESFLIVKSSDRNDALGLCNRPIPKISSQIHPTIDGGKAFLRVLLELFLLRLCNTLEHVENYVTHTMVFLECHNSVPSSTTILLNSVHSLLRFLVSANAIELFSVDNPHQLLTEQDVFIGQQKSSVGIRITRFGRSVAESNLNPDEAISIYEDLMRAREQGINLESNLHLLYLITPQSLTLTPDYRKLLTVYEQSRNRGDSLHLIFDAIGIDTTLLVKWTHIPPSYEQLSSCVDRLKLFKIRSNHQDTSRSHTSSSSGSHMDENECMMLYRCLRIWAASALSMLVESQSPARVASSYNVTMNDIMNLQKTACYLGSRIVRFCQEIGWSSVEKLISFISNLINIEPEKEIQDLMLLEGMTTKLARTLYDNGYESIIQLANSNEDDLIHRLLLSKQFEIIEDSTSMVSTSGSTNSAESLYSFCSSLITKARTFSQQQNEIKHQEEHCSDSMEEMIEQDSSSDNESDTTSDSSSSSSSEEMMMGYMYEIKTNNNNNETSMKLPSAVSDCDIYATQLPAIVDEHIPEEEISDEALLQLMENFDAKKQHTTTSTSINMTTEVEENQQNENISEKTPWRKVEKTHFTPYLSPYLQPFTPSKCSTPGRYLYLPSLDDTSNHQLSSSNKKKNISQQPNQLKTFYWKHLSERQNCHEFLDKLRECNSFSFELVFDSIPFSSNGLSRAIVSRAWAPMISSCHTSTSTSTIQDSKGNQNTFNLPEMLVGISLCFGDDVGYYLPLPKILPLLSFNQPQTPRIETRRIPGLDTLPDRAMILICRYVGFGSILHKCPGLYPTETNWNFLLNSNPLFLVSRSWAECSRRSLRYEWMRGQCLEWRLLGKIMNSTKFCKIGFNIKEKIICLRERDVIVHGSIQDPYIALILLEMEPSRISSNFIKSSNKNHIKEACYLAINTFHCMIELEQKLLIHQLWSTFITIEMPLCHTVADAELHGIPINTSFFVDLRQDLNDRIKLIENFFYITQGIQFNLTNHKDITQLKKKLQLEEENHPILQIIQEWRSHTRMLPLCNLILNHRCRPYGYYIDRTRGKYHSIGTETGRLIITSPPLQQIPHSCSYIPPKRASIDTEIRKAKLLNSNFIEDVNRKASSGEFEWVRVTKMMQNKSLNDLYESDFYTNNEMKPNNIISSSSTGRLISITSTSIDKIFIPVPHHIENTSTSTSTSSSTISLLELWKQAGYHQYSTSTSSTNNDDEDNQDILGVLVNINNKVYSYPADQVFRLQSSIIPDPNETLQLHSSLNIQQQQPPQQQQQPIENISKIILNPRDGFQATPGYIFISSDYSQIELRLFAHFAMDKKLYDAFIHDEDVFKSIASQWKSKDIHSITDIERNSVKQLCYALLYGAGPNKVAIDANCSLQEAELMIENFLKYYSGIPKFISEVKKRCRINGYVETMLGRKRHLPHIRSLDKKERLKAERQAVNTVCQGSAADLIKLAMINIHYCLCKRFEGRNFHSRRSYPGGGIYSILDSIRLVLQIHDELIYEVPEAYVQEVGFIVKSCMENAVELNVPLKVKLFSGQTWGTMKPLELDHNKFHEIKNELFPVRELESLYSTTKISSLQPIARCIFQDNED